VNVKLLSMAEAAALLGISRQAVHKRIKAGKLAAVRVGWQYCIPAEAIAR
jgi:excisionase family DNA binding protein